MTKNPRLTMTLTPSLSARLRRLSELTGNSQASLVSELLEGQEIVFDRIIRALEAAQLAREEMVPSLMADLDKSRVAIEAQLGLALDEMDRGIAPLVDEMEAIKRRRARVGPGSGSEHAKGGPRIAGGSLGARSGPAPGASRKSLVRDPHLLTGGSKS